LYTSNTTGMYYLKPFLDFAVQAGRRFSVEHPVALNKARFYS